MRHHRYLLLPILCALATSVASAASAPKTVGDFFLLVPEKFFPYDVRFREELLGGKHRGAVVDVRNGYISWDASDAPDSFEFAIFRKSNGTYVVAYNDTGDDFDEEGKNVDLILLSYDGKTWRDVTKALMPVPLKASLGYKLPRHGRAIEVTDQGRDLYRLTWDNDRFRLERPRRGDRE